MPAGDRTGPLGQGPGTGRALGFCYGYESPGYMKGPGMRMGRGFGFRGGAGYGRGFGRGRGRGFSPGYHDHPYMSAYPWAPSLSREDEIRILKSESEALKRSQKEIERRLGELEKEE
ncbi:MAG: DUF5320 domain-containing protein [Bacteroidales bacterium]|nr:DUF5320 domain-containing protein [Bacteroidales bacterium]